MCIRDRDNTVVDELYAAFDKSMAEQLGATPAPNGEKIGACLLSTSDSRIFTLWSAMRSKSPISRRYSAVRALSVSPILRALNLTR